MQREAWEREYRRGGTVIPTIARKRPSSAVRAFEDYLAENGFRLRGPILDLGCGNGRHLFHFARKGFGVWGLDFVPALIASLRRAVRGKPRIHVLEHALPRRLPFRDAMFGGILDITATVSLDEREHRTLRHEVLRVLRPGGWFIGYYISDRNAYLRRGPYYRGEKAWGRDRRYVPMVNGLVERVWNISDLVAFWRPLLPHLVAIRKKKDRFGKKIAEIEMIVAIFRK